MRMTLYSVCHANGIVGFVMHIPEDGIEVADGMVRWKSGTGTVEQSLADLEQVRLYTIPAGKYRNAGRGELTFRNGRALSVFGTGRLGLHDPVRASAYRGLMLDLHAQIPAQARSRIRFLVQRPAQPQWIWVALTLVVLATGVFLAIKVGVAGIVGLLILLALMAVRFVPLFLSGSGGGGPKGDAYNPDAIPNHLMP
jgi:hypothetical protein